MVRVGLHVRGVRYLPLIALAGLAKGFVFTLTLLPWAASAGVSQSAQGKLIVAVPGADALAIVDPDHPENVQKVATQKQPQDIVLSPEGTLAYIAEMGTTENPGSTIAVLNTQSLKITRRIELKPATLPHLLVLSHDGRTLWAACAPQDAIAEVDTQTGTLRRVWDTQQKGSYLLVAMPDESKLYVANFDAGTVTMIPRSGAPAKLIRIGGEPIGIDVSPSGNEVWVSSLRTDTITIIGTAKDEVIHQIPAGGKGSARLKFTADGNRVYVAMSETNELVGFDAANRTVVQRIPTGKFSKGLLLLPDGRRAFVSAMDEGRVADVNLVSGQVSQWLTTGPSPEGSVWLTSRSGSDVRDADLAMLLAIHRDDRSAHFQHDPEALVAHWDPETVSISDGKITRQTREQMQERVAQEFRGREYSLWDDLEPPIVEISADHLMAWVVVRVEVKSVITAPDGVKKPEHFIYAGTTTFRKHGGKWWKTSTTSTFETE
jgi:DNA-binding beta-propeller fold protein YncE